MKFIALMITIFFSIAVYNSYSVFSKRFYTDETFTGGGVSVDGDYNGHHEIYDGDGNWVKNQTDCPPSSINCYTTTRGAGYVDFHWNALTGFKPLDTNATHIYEDKIENGVLTNTFIGPYAP